MRQLKNQKRVQHMNQHIGCVKSNGPQAEKMMIEREAQVGEKSEWIVTPNFKDAGRVLNRAVLNNLNFIIHLKRRMERIRINCKTHNEQGKKKDDFHERSGKITPIGQRKEISKHG